MMMDTVTYQRPEMGKWYQIGARAEKRHATVKHPQLGQGRLAEKMGLIQATVEQTFWASQSFEARGMFVGVRRVFDGYMDWHNDIDGGEEYFVQTQVHEVWLFVLNPHHNPIYVFPAHVRGLNVVTA